MRNLSVCVVTCLASALALTQAMAQTEPQTAGSAAAVDRQPVSETPQGAVPRLIRFSGAVNPAEVKAGAPAGIEFAIYKEESGGAALWSEIQNVETDTSGHFTVLLGATKNGGVPPDALGIGESRWVGVTPSGGTPQPRVRLVSVPYALRAEEALRIAGAPASDFVRKADLTDSVREAMRTAKPDAAAGQGAQAAASGPTTFAGNTTTRIVAVQQNGTGKAIVATATSGIGTVSTGGSTGVYGGASAATGIGVQGVATATTGASTGVLGTSSSTAGIGVQGSVNAPTGSGVFGVNNATTGERIRRQRQVLERQRERRGR